MTSGIVIGAWISGISIRDAGYAVHHRTLRGLLRMALEVECHAPSSGSGAADAADDPGDRRGADREGDQEDRQSAGVDGGVALVFDERPAGRLAAHAAGEERDGGGDGRGGEAGAVGAARGPA